MGRILYIDAFSGISGDKTLAAFVDLGLPLADLRRELSRMALGGYRIEARAVERSWMRGTQVEVTVEGDHGHRGRSQIHAIVSESTLPEIVKEKALAIFDRILEVEARIHGIPVEEVHLHEVGAVDAIVDIVGAVVAAQWLSADRIVASPVNVGGGTVSTAHGILPVPAPATAELLLSVPVVSHGPTFELTTPTGAALVTGLAGSFGPMPAMTLDRIGYGAGAKDFPGFPNLLRLCVGTEPTADGPCGAILLETNVDDCAPAVLAHAMERMFAAGALDVFFQPIQMKKGRPGVLLSAIVDRGALDAVADVIFRETSSIGLRYQELERMTLQRRFVGVTTPWGDVALKVSTWRGDEVRVSPEFEDARRVALAGQVPLQRVLEEALSAYRRGESRQR